ncbi:hypothetical protein [Paraburkholderia sacchari]
MMLIIHSMIAANNESTDYFICSAYRINDRVGDQDFLNSAGSGDKSTSA